jgi:alkylhydroperoxidase/carboxymuconolactone decarboxylase family protein YurZ
VTAHTAAGKLQGLSEDAPWYEAAFVVGVTNAMNVAADGLSGPCGADPLIAPLAEAEASRETREVFAEIRAFYRIEEAPIVFRLVAHDAVYLADFWAAVRRAFSDNCLTRRVKETLAFAVSLTTRSQFGTAFHLGEMRRLGVTETGVREVLGVTQTFSSYTKIADTLQLEQDMRDMAPVDWSPAPGGPPRE